MTQGAQASGTAVLGTAAAQLQMISLEQKTDDSIRDTHEVVEHQKRTIQGWCETKFKDFEQRMTAMNQDAMDTKKAVEKVVEAQKEAEETRKADKAEGQSNHSAG